MKPTLLAIAVTALVGCQTYDFEPVTPLAVGQTTQTKKIVAHQLKPNMMILIDKSGSMLTNTTTVAPCPGAIGGCGAGNPCPAGCATRISDLKAAMTAFLTDPMNTGSATVARVGAAYFPKDSLCGATSTSEVLVDLLPPALADDDNALKTQSAQVDTAINNVLPMPVGGTPTADSIRFVGTLQELQDSTRDNFVLLLTDGVPNCNANNPNNSCTATNPACNCTTSSCAVMTPFCAEGCLNADDSVAAIKELRSKPIDIKTIVVGFGACGQMGNMSADCANAPQTLNQMASAGGFARACPMGTDAECQSMGVTDTCNIATKLCNQSFFAAANATELSAALAKISAGINQNDICTYQLDSMPSDPKFLSVTVDGQSLQGCGVSAMGMAVPGCNTWTYDISTGVPKVTFQGMTCDKVKGATPQNPVNVDFRIVQSL